MQNTNIKAGFHALLMGINCYLPNELPNGLYYKSLWGCVGDVNRVEAFLRENLHVPGEHITKLTSSRPIEGSEPPEPRSQWPSYENIVNAFKRLTNVAQEGDQVFIHYSGHGGRTLTTEQFKDIKGPGGLDEVLVPMDLGDSEGRYLRDTELHFLIQKMVEKKLYVTIVLDSCHAGGATRSFLDPALGRARVRGVAVIDTFKRRSESLVASPEELREAWLTGAQPKTRKIEVSSGWLLEPKDYVLIAACRANEYANEIVFEGSEKNGALSYWLVDSLKQLGPDFTYEMLHSRLLAKVHGQFAAQSPQLQGEGQRVVFGVTERLQLRSVPVITVDTDGLITINAGLAHGVDHGAQFGIYATDESDFANKENRIAVVEVVESSAVSCRARILNQVASTTIEPGYHAILLDAGRVKLRGGIRVVTREDQPEASTEALKAVQQSLEAVSEGWTNVVGNEETPDYLLAVEQDEYVICDTGGNQIPNLRPPLKISDSNSVGRVIERLTHLVKYTNVRELDNNDASSNISQKFVVELVNTPPDFKPGSPVRPQPLASLGQSITVSDDGWAFLRIRNNYDPYVLNVTVLDLESTWRISQIYPSRAASYEPIDPGREIILPLHVTLPEGYQSATEIIKVFATIDTTSFRSLELPPLDQPPTPRSMSRDLLRNPLEAFLARFETPKSARAVTVDVCASVEWTVHQVEVEVVGKHQQLLATSSLSH
jgi:caspase domain-containing protein